ncbi:phosphatidylserine decarboxylase-domain-containing protein [Gigaspora rosea]|uniref:Phosphatidylserine decarboxylase proenzyme 2 n=1 Tax=Gigaspora rosea TaxID=44941 RepID=A0A397UWT7_9GLOM|nr:phosphatidylserine decarboxylase-domain-containing protein [Gigaspora rosea]
MATPHYILKIDIIKAKNLAIKDKNGFSDPYITVNVGDESYNTQVVNKNLNPVWDASFEYKVNPEHPPSEINFTCWDRDIFGRDYMGETSIPLDKFCEGGHIGYHDQSNKPRWYKLISNRKKETVSGEVSIKIGFIDKDNEFLDNREWVSIWNRMNNLKIEESSNISSNVSTAVENTLKIKPERQYSYSQANDVVGLTFVEIVRAIDLPAARNVTGLGFDMDPFVVISFSKHTFRTHVINHSLNPEWNEKLHFPVKKIELEKFVIKFSVYDWDKLTENDLVATKNIPIKQIYDCALKKTQGKNSYEIKEQNIGDGMEEIELSLDLHDIKWADKNKPKLIVRLKYVPYEHLRIQFWRALAKTYDSDENGVLNFVEVETMLNSLGSSLTNKTISSFFTRFGKDPEKGELEFSELINCLEEWLSDVSRRSADSFGEESDNEHLIFMKECPICHRPDLTHLFEADIITHVSICASNDWTEVNKIVTGDFITESQAQRKWLSKVINKVGYGSFRIGANSANILSKNRETGLIEEEKMTTYVRLGIRLLYKDKQRIESKTTKNLLKKLTDQQGKKFDKPTSAEEIRPFIAFHGLNTEEILEPIDSFKNFNEFFYRKLKPDARKCDSPEDPRVLVSPADCRMMCFPTINEATKIWIKGTTFTISKLLGDEEMGKEFEGGSLGIFRLAPQDYHRFHIPVEGTLSEPVEISGEYYTVNPMAIRSELDVYCLNKRAVSYIDSPQFGKVAYVSIGAMMVGSIILTSKPNTHVKRFEEHGYFAFGGSTIVLLFQKGRMLFDEDILENSKEPLETLVKVGMHVGKATIHYK